jgi:hypothetical protein
VTSSYCKCGHHRTVHRLRDTRCNGTWPAGKNEIGARLYQWCRCHSYRPTEVSFWQRILHGTEEHKHDDHA